MSVCTFFFSIYRLQEIESDFVCVHARPLRPIKKKHHFPDLIKHKYKAITHDNNIPLLGLPPCFMHVKRMYIHTFVHTYIAYIYLHTNIYIHRYISRARFSVVFFPLSIRSFPVCILIYDRNCKPNPIKNHYNPKIIARFRATQPKQPYFVA